MPELFDRRYRSACLPIETLEPRRLLSAAIETEAAALGASSATVMAQTESTTVASRQVTVSLRAWPGSVRVGSNFYADVVADAGTPKGLVYFYADGQPIGAGWVVNGQAWMHTNHLPAGIHNVYAVYSGDAEHDRAASNAITHEVLAASAPLAKAVFGRWDWRGNGSTQVVGLYAPGAAIIPSGTLTFHDRPSAEASTWKVTATLDAHGRALFGNIDPPDDLVHLYYTYSGDANYPPEQNLIFIPTPYTPAAPAPTGMALSVHKSATNPGEPLTIRAVLQRPSAQTLSAAYSGTVQFWHEEMFLGTAIVDATGVATLTVRGTETGGNHVITSEGLHVLRAVYSGDATHAPVEREIWHAVVPSARLTRTTLTASKLTARQDEPIIFTATVTDVFDNPATGQPGYVRLLDEWGKELLPPVRVENDGTATFHFYRFPADTYGVRAVYLGTLNADGFTPSRSPEMTVTVTPGVLSARPTITARIVSVSTTRYPANLIVTLTGSDAPTPTGQIAVYHERPAGSDLIGYGNIAADGTVTMPFEPGDNMYYQKLRIVYLGDGNYAPTNATLSLTPTYRYLEEKTPAGLPASANLAFSADVDGDGVKDLVYRDSTTGGVILRLMDAAGQTTSIKTLPAAPLETWALDAGGDVNGDGVADLLWRNLSSSRAYVWFLGAGGRLQDQGYINANGTAAGWRIVGTGDFNADGRADIVWSNDLTGQRAVWLLNGRNVRGVTMFNHAPRDTAWIIESIEDLDGDGDDDLLWRNTKTGGTFGWLLTGTAVTGGLSAT